jgi:ribonuclease HI
MENHKMTKKELFPKDKIVLYTDGGARGNPGPAAVGVVIDNRHYSKVIGETTNNVAEYKAVIFGLQRVKQLLGKEKSFEIEVAVRSDSELMVSQLNGVYKIKDAELKELFIEVWNLKQDFKKVVFVLIRREENRAADKLVNQTLDTLF